MEATTGAQTATPTQQDPGIAQDTGIQNQTAEGAASAGTDLVKDAAKEAARKLKLKHDDGTEEEVDEAEVLKTYKERKGHQRVANKELQEGKAAKKQAEQFLSMLKSKDSLFEVIQKMGHNPRQLAEEYLAQQLQDEMMDPREKELRDAKNKLKSYEDLEKKQKEELQKRAEDEMKKKFTEQYSKDFISALQETGLPATKGMVAEMSKYIARAAKIDFEMTPQEAAKLVKEDIENSYKNLYGEADADTLVKLLGEPGLQKIRDYDVKRLKNPNANLKTPTEQGEKSPRTKPAERMSYKEWRKFNRGF